MAVVQGIKEKVHSPIYDALTVEPGEQVRDVESSSTLKFFVDVQGKTKLETNLQSAALLPHYNTFEARAMRVVISDQPATFPDEEDINIVEPAFPLTDEQDRRVDANGAIQGVPSTGAFDPVLAVLAELDLNLGLDQLVELIREARESEDGYAVLSPDEDGISLTTTGFDAPAGGTDIPPRDLTDDEIENVLAAGAVIFLPLFYLESYLDELPENEQPLEEQIEPNNGAGTLISKFIYNTVTTLYVGEKIMIQMPTYFFPAGAGPYSEAGAFTTHGEPSPTATFRFAEPIFIDKQQNFRVEIEIPDTDILKRIQRIYGPFQIWVILDGYMTRDVQ
jgi:hypothetical protein